MKEEVTLFNTDKEDINNVSSMNSEQAQLPTRLCVSDRL